MYSVASFRVHEGLGGRSNSYRQLDANAAGINTRQRTNCGVEWCVGSFEYGRRLNGLISCRAKCAAERYNSSCSKFWAQRHNNILTETS